MTLLVRDEIDLVERNINFHLERGIDEVVAIDNGSTDGTREILEEMSKSAPITVMHEPGRDYDQTTWVTRAAVYARDRLGADWILNNDADEFWTSKDGSLKDVISSLQSHNILLCPRRNMICGYETLGDRPWSENLVHRVAKSVKVPAARDFHQDSLPCPYFYLDLPPKALVQAKNLVKVDQGNHSAQYTGPVSAVEAPIYIYHFPVRSRDQFRKKITQGGAAYENNTQFSEQVGWHWRRLYRLIREQGVDAALADALPSTSMIDAHIRSGVVIEDQGFRNAENKTFDGAKR